MSVGSGRRCSKGVLAGALAVALLYMVARADGLHCKVLDGDDLEEAWRRLVRQTWPERKDATAPRVSSHKERPLVETAIKETLAVLQFVDAYNYADDSPAWMATEDGRNKAREQSRKILLELGRGAAPFVWQAADNEIRFSANKEKPDALVKPFRDAQKALREALALLEGERRQDGEYVKTYDAIEALRPAAHKLEFLEKIAADLRKQKIGAKDKLDKLKELETQAGEIDARIKALGDLRDLGQRMKDLQAKLAERLKVVDETPKVADLKTAADAARKKLDDAMRAAGGLGQGLLDGGDPAMVSGDDFLGTLKEVLAAMGPEALPQVSLGLRSPNPELRKFAESIQNAWTAPGRAAEFARAAADGKTQVALAAGKFLKDRLRTAAVDPLLKELEKAPEADRAALFGGLKLATGAVNVPDELPAWQKWWTENKPTIRKTEAVQDE
ncbi:MAG: hypothetical protein HY291_07080 [Planctomycetes bacterium]|nr:hypothetical protein [Planctomycetota bacterium]